MCNVREKYISHRDNIIKRDNPMKYQPKKDRIVYKEYRDTRNYHNEKDVEVSFHRGLVIRIV